MVHRNAPLAEAGRLTLLQRVLWGRPVSHVATELGVSRQCAYRWVRRFRRFGAAGLLDRSSRRRSHPATTSATVAARLLHLRWVERLGLDELAGRVGVSPSTASRIIARAGLPALHELDPATGISTTTEAGCDRRSSAWSASTSPSTTTAGSRWPVCCPTRPGRAARAFLLEAAAFFANHGIAVREVMTDNAMNYRLSGDFQAALTALGAKHVLTRPPSPWQDGNAERFDRTLQEGWAYSATLHLQPAPHRRPRALTAPLQLRSAPHRLRRPAPDQPNLTNDLTEHT